MSLVPTMSAAIAPVTAAIVTATIVASMAVVTTVTGERVVGRTSSLPGEALTRGDKDRETADCQQQQSKRPSDWDHPSFTRAGAARRGIGGWAMNSVPAVPVAAHIMGMTSIPGVVTIAGAYGLTVRALFWRGQDHTPKEKENDAGECRQQNSEMHPTGRVHLNSPLFPRPRRQFNSTKRM